MRVTARAALIAMVLVLGGAAAAWADSCFVTLSGELLVGKGFALPGRGNCRTFSGYFAFTSAAVSGNACGTSDNTLIRFNLQSSNSAFDAPDRWVMIVLDRSSLTGAATFCAGTLLPCDTELVAKVACPSNRPFN